MNDKNSAASFGGQKLLPVNVRERMVDDLSDNNPRQSDSSGYRGSHRRDKISKDFGRDSDKSKPISIAVAGASAKKEKNRNTVATVT